MTRRLAAVPLALLLPLAACFDPGGSIGPGFDGDVRPPVGEPPPEEGDLLTACGPAVGLIARGPGEGATIGGSCVLSTRAGLALFNEVPVVEVAGDLELTGELRDGILPSLTSVRGFFGADRAQSLERLLLPALEQAGVLHLRDNPRLESVELPALARVNHAFYVEANPLLPACAVAEIAAGIEAGEVVITDNCDECACE